jgi:threonine dehydrogenase-like Zn-dependent dehydrogenase
MGNSHEHHRGSCMKAIIYSGPLTIENVDIAPPEPVEGEVTVCVRAAGICGSELEGVRNQSPFRIPPLVMGHEFAGVRADTGQRVAVNPIISCGNCDLCDRGLTQICRRRQIVGIHRPGAFAESVAVPSQSCHALPEAVSDEQGSLIEPFANAVHARSLALALDPAPGRIGVIGAGAIGLAIASLCASDDTAGVVLCERASNRLERARRLEDVALVNELEGEFDVIFDAVGAVSARVRSIEQLRPGGVAIWVGLHAEAAELPAQSMIRTEKRVIGSFAYSDPEFSVAVRAVQRIQPWWFETRPLAQGAEVFGALLEQPSPAARTVLVNSAS